jgi:hypothetical protein
MIARLSQSSLVYLNLALGLLVAVANGAALLLVVTGKAEKLSGQAFEIAAWSLAGLLLAISAGYALRRVDRIDKILQFQTYLVVALVGALALWALMLLIGATSSSTRVVWAVGYLSILALYCSVLGSHAFLGDRYLMLRRSLTWVMFPACVAIDILTYAKTTV